MGELYIHACILPMSIYNSSEAISSDSESYVVALVLIVPAVLIFWSSFWCNGCDLKKEASHNGVSFITALALTPN